MQPMRKYDVAWPPSTHVCGTAPCWLACAHQGRVTKGMVIVDHLMKVIVE